MVAGSGEGVKGNEFGIERTTNIHYIAGFKVTVNWLQVWIVTNAYFKVIFQRVF